MTAAQTILDTFPRDREYLLIALRKLQDSSGTNSLAPEDITLAAGHFRLSLAQVFGVATYYSMFSAEQRGRHIIRVCRSPVCRMMGSGDLLEAAESILGIQNGETTGDGAFTLELCECLGNCHEAPSVMIDGDIRGVRSREELRSLIEGARKGENNG